MSMRRAGTLTQLYTEAHTAVQLAPSILALSTVPHTVFCALLWCEWCHTVYFIWHIVNRGFIFYYIVR